MKIEEYENKIFHLIDAKPEYLYNVRFPEDLVSMGYDENNLNLTLLLAIYTPFRNEIIGARKKLKLEIVEATYDKKEEYLDAILTNLDEVSAHELSDCILSIIDMFKLDDSWAESIAILLFFDLFFVPHLAVVGIREANSDSTDILGYPAIYFIRKTSPTELINWIKANSFALDALQRDLPERNVHRISMNTIFSGCITYYYRKTLGVTSWAKIRDANDYLDKKYELTRPVETEVELKDNYKSFVKKYYEFTESLKS